MMRILLALSVLLTITCSPWTGVTYRASVRCVGVGRAWVCDCIPMAPSDMLWPGLRDEIVTIRCVVYMNPARRAIGSADVWVQ